MSEQIQKKGGFTVTAAGFILLNSIYTVAKLPLNILFLVPKVITRVSIILGIPEIYSGAIIALLTLTLVFALISLLFRKDF